MKRISLGTGILLYFFAVVSIMTIIGTGGCGKDNNDSAPTGQSWSFAVLCDSRSSYASDLTSTVNNYNPYYSADGTSPIFQNVAKALARETGIDFVLFPGDLVRGKKPTMSQMTMTTDLTQWKTYMQPVMDAGIPVYYVRGNHDQYAVSDPTSTTPINTGYADALNIWNSLITLPASTVNPITMSTSTTMGMTYSFTHKGSLFLAVDEYNAASSGTATYDKSFVTNQLASTAYAHKFVMAHQPLWNLKSDETTSYAGLTTLADDLQAGHTDLYFSGHVHSYQRIAETGYRFQEMIVGTAGAPQDDPTVDSTGTGYVADPNLTIKSYTGGANENARVGYVIITVHPDGSLTSVLKFLDNPTSPTSAVSTFDAATVTPQ
jgi:Icc-related predicted phosphoesterase